jgi:hypothetical protein
MSAYSHCGVCHQQLNHSALFCSCCRCVVCGPNCLHEHVKGHLGDHISVQADEQSTSVFAVNYFRPSVGSESMS